jgi:hypothetical protein
MGAARHVTPVQGLIAMIHGTRRTYQDGCSCTPCRAAEATYRARLRSRHARGLPILGALVSASETWRRIRQLRPELDTQGEIARRLGLKRPIVELHTGPDAKTTMRTLLRVKRLHRLILTGGLPESDGSHP